MKAFFFQMLSEHNRTRILPKGNTVTGKHFNDFFTDTLSQTTSLD